MGWLDRFLANQLVPDLGAPMPKKSGNGKSGVLLFSTQLLARSVTKARHDAETIMGGSDEVPKVGWPRGGRTGKSIIA